MNTSQSQTRSEGLATLSSWAAGTKGDLLDVRSGTAPWPLLPALDTASAMVKSLGKGDMTSVAARLSMLELYRGLGRGCERTLS